MFGIFKDLGAMAGMMKNLPKIQEEMARFNETVKQLTAEGEAGAGMVKIQVNGLRQVVRCEISEETFQEGDRELLEDLIRSATNQAMEKIELVINEERTKMMSALGMPAGMDLPNMPGV